MFKIVNSPIAPESGSFAGAGGYVTFVGKVRNEHEGREVVRLEYEAHPELAESEGTDLLAEAVARFGLTDARAVHRTGLLQIGETAVWIEVAAPHRAAAFEACEWIIGEIKRRVPIWKKEHYADGDSGWIGTDPVVPVEPTPETGNRVLLVGSWSSPETGRALAEAGAGFVRMVRTVSGHAKTGLALDQAAASLRAEAPALQVETVNDHLSQDTLQSLFQGCGVIVDGTAEYATTSILHRTARETGVPFVMARDLGVEGQVMSIVPGGPCLECLWPYAHPPGSREVASPSVVTEILAARETGRILQDRPHWASSVLLIDTETGVSTTVERLLNARCPRCGDGRFVPSHTADRTWEVDSLEAARVALGRFHALDVREPEEEPRALPGWESEWSLAPLSLFDPSLVEGDTPVVLVCRSGRRTGNLTDHLRAFGKTDVFSLGGGVVRFS